MIKIYTFLYIFYLIVLKMNFDYGFKSTSYGVISFDENNMPHPFPGSFHEDERNIISTAKGPMVFITYGCNSRGFREYSYLEFHKSPTELSGKFITQTTKVEKYIIDHFTEGPSFQRYHTFFPKESSATEEFLKELEESTMSFMEKYYARKKYERDVSEAKEKLSIYKAKCDASQFISSGGAFKKNLKLLEKNSKLDEAQIEIMRKNSKGILSIHDFLEENSNNSSEKGVVIGLNHASVIDGLVSIIGYESYVDTYERYYGNFMENKMFMNDLTAEGKPIIFLVPNDVLTHEKRGATARELEWLLEHPEKMENVTFIFGAYDCIPNSKDSEQFTPPHKDIQTYMNTYHEILARRIFKQCIQQVVRMPKMPEGHQTFQDLIEFDTHLSESEVDCDEPIIEEIEPPTYTMKSFSSDVKIQIVEEID